MLEFEVLGPLVVRGEKATIPVAGARRRALLVRLLVDANELVPASRLVEDVWAEEASTATASTLQSHISLLRKALGPGRLVGRDGGYVLDVAPDELDARRFETEARQGRDAMAAGDPSSASRLLSMALDRWHGAALADVTGSAWARPEQARLEELRLGAFETWLEARLALGEHQEVAALAEAAVTDHPLREQIWAHLMVALYRSGRQSDALRTYQRLRKLLGEELGIEPSAQLVALDDAIVQQRPELEWSRSGTAATEGRGWHWATVDGLSQVVGDGVDTDFPLPPLHAQPERKHNLPEQISSFVGRAQEQEAVRSLIESQRLVTLVGPGGTGKTRLALETALQQLHETRDGVWLVELASVTDRDLVASTCAAALGIAEQPDRQVLDALVDALRNKHVLVVLDNCEHLLNACSTVALALLKECPQVQLLCTSREPLSLTGEYVYRVPPLSLPHVSQESSLEALLTVDAVALFCERAISHQPEFVLDEGNATAVCSICRALDGIPLALELAAARVEAMSVKDLEARLDERFRLLTRGSRGALPRQQTLRGLVDWSFDLLEADERTAMCRFSVFSGGWRLPEAEEVIVRGEISDLDVLDLLSSLVRKSLVQLDTGTGIARYRMLETIRQYAAEQAAARDEFSATARVHAQVYAALAERAAGQLRGSEAAEGLERLDEELDNLRAAAAHLLSQPDSGRQVLGLAVALCSYWEIRGYFTEGISLLHAAIDRPDTQAPGLLRATALSCLAGLDLRSGSVTEASRCSRDGLAMAQAHGDALVSSELLRTLVSATAMQGDLGSETFDMADEAVTLARVAEDAFAIGRALMTRGSLLCVSGAAGARTDWQEALSLLRAAGDRVFVANTLGNLAYMDMLEGDPTAARARLVEAVALARDIGALGNIPSLMVNLGLAELLNDNGLSAVQSLRESLVAADRIGDQQGVASAIIGLALCAGAAGNLARAASLYGAADALCQENDLPLGPLERKLADDDRVKLRDHLDSGDFDRALEAGRRIPARDRLPFALD